MIFVITCLRCSKLKIPEKLLRWRIITGSVHDQNIILLILIQITAGARILVAVTHRRQYVQIKENKINEESQPVPEFCSL